MQRSHKIALLRRSVGKTLFGTKLLCNISFSFVVLLWSLIFLLHLWIGQSDNCADLSRPEALSGEIASNKVEPKMSKISGLENFVPTETHMNDNLGTCVANDESLFDVSSVLDNQVDEMNLDQDIPKEYSDLENSSTVLEENQNKNRERSCRIAPPGLHEFKSKAIDLTAKLDSGQHAIIIHRTEPDGSEYNYASDIKGAKVLACNKESKGASNILSLNKDKYLRNPCSAEEKFVIIELSEETLVDTIQIANFEHYSSNLKDFELLTSMVYPTNKWDQAGDFTAGNTKHKQRFALPEPKWARYLNLNLLSHYGSEFYCTLSVIEVYGVDAVERMLEDLISAQDTRIPSKEQGTEQISMVTQVVMPEGNDLNRKVLSTEDELNPQYSSIKREVKGNFPDPVTETRPQQIGRMPGDTVLKILMQKVRSLDLNFAVLERYIEELNTRYGNIFKDFDNEISDKDSLLKHTRLEINELAHSKDVLTEEIKEIITWKTLMSSSLDILLRDNSILRSEVERVVAKQVHMEKKGIAIIFICFVFGCIASLKILTDLLMSICKYKKICRTSSSWILLLLCCSILIILLVL